MPRVSPKLEKTLEQTGSSAPLRRVLARGESEVDLVAIETSGVCDPGPVLDTLAQLEHVGARLHLDSVLAVVDAGELRLNDGAEGEAKASSGKIIPPEAKLLLGGLPPP